MRVLVCGGQDYSDQYFLFQVLDTLNLGDGDVIIHGGAFGADALAGKWARERKIEELAYRINKKKFGKEAVYVLNVQMATDGAPDLVIAFPGGKGTAHMLEIASKLNIPFHNYALLLKDYTAGQ